MPVTIIYVSSFSSNVLFYSLLSNAEQGVYSYASQAPSSSGFLLGPATRGTQRRSGVSRRAGALPLLAHSVSMCPKGVPVLAQASLLTPEPAPSCLSGVPEAATCLTHLAAQNPDLLCPSSPFFPSPRGTSSEKAMAPHSSTLAWKTSWTEEPGRLQSMGSRRVGHN